MKEILTSIEIAATPERVWTVLTDFEAYDEWNPFARIAGKPNVGAHPQVRLTPPDGRAMTFRPEVTVVEPDRELRWLGHLYVPGLFDGEHRFVLEPLDGGARTRFVHAETFGGVLAGPLLRMVGDDTQAGFEAMNGALKRRAEERTEKEQAPRPSTAE
ncbi:SRPBCC domain-containing protein [Halogeometricum sp. S1BR25-6]|uniref:SRPBCC domain-containing protein n=1 Tax=Halogeometricum salsisoli TaxID=2950536 RepID=A0ABU2G9E7_9EURY|nr:SRPBCC domain-containing protein [Halogeometricum sp. S1BR25-6]MDS0297430.1 SRPBCC domain-containing protein [Halogeometricum sp. S1BR25-6]